jgi:hypothetical protein
MLLFFSPRMRRRIFPVIVFLWTGCRRSVNQQGRTKV